MWCFSHSSCFSGTYSTFGWGWSGQFISRDTELKQVWMTLRTKWGSETHQERACPNSATQQLSDSPNSWNGVATSQHLPIQRGNWTLSEQKGLGAPQWEENQNKNKVNLKPLNLFSKTVSKNNETWIPRVPRLIQENNTTARGRNTQESCSFPGQNYTEGSPLHPEVGPDGASLVSMEGRDHRVGKY